MRLQEEEELKRSIFKKNLKQIVEESVHNEG